MEEQQLSPAVLFVDDEKNILTSLRRLMMEEDCRVFTAESGQEGLEVLSREAQIGLIVSDQRMPGMNGAAFLEKAREIAPDPLRIILTGYADIQATMDAINKGGAFRYITKPWNDDELIQTIRDALSRYTLLQENRRLQAVVQAQNEELKEWNARLKSRVLQQTADIRAKNEELDRRNRQLVHNFHATIASFSNLLELRSRKLRHHSRNVAALTALMAEGLGLCSDERETLRIASLLHDIGEIGTPDALIHDEIGDLEGGDLATYMQHTVRGQAAVDAIEELRPAGLLIRHHHEHFDGGGLPDALAGEEIPLGARLIHVCDFLDRCIARQYDISPTVGYRVALEEVRALLESWFDPALFTLLETAAREVYGRIPPRSEMTLRTLEPDDLMPGMVLDDDLLTGTGLMLLNRGSVLTRKAIESIQRYHQIDPIHHAIPVLVAR